MHGFHCTDYMSISKSRRRTTKRCMVAYLFQKVSYTRMKLENAQEYFFHHCGQVEFILEKMGMHARIFVLKDGYRGL